MAYKVWRKVFATLEEASFYAHKHFEATGEILCVEITQRKPTHCIKDIRREQHG